MNTVTIKRCLLLHLLLIIQIWAIVNCKSYYTIFAPGSLKSNRNYTVVITLHDADRSAIIRVGILRTPLYYSYQDVELEPFESKAIDFSVPSLSRDYKYELIAEGVKGIEFKNATEIHVSEIGGVKVYIQTNKGTYKPGDLLEFRVFILNEHLKPLKLQEPIKVEIKDDNDYRVKQYKDITLNKGMFSGNLYISEQPNLGVWKIVVDISGRYDYRETKPIIVMEYTLPKFSVYLDSPDDFVNEDHILHVIVYGKYTYGRYVEGIVVAKIMYDYHVFHTQTATIEDNKAKFEFNITSIIRINKPLPSFDVKATLIDKLTNYSQTTTKKINWHNDRYKIEVPMNEVEFHNNRPVSMKAYVRYLNGTEVKDNKTPIFMKHGSKTYQALLDDHGAAKIIFENEPGKSNLFFFKKTTLYLPNMFYSGPDNDIESLCSLTLRSGKLHMGKLIEIDLSSRLNIPYIVYTFTGHGNIIYSKYVKLPENQKSYTIKILPSIEIIPMTDLCVHYIVEGQLNYCDLRISLPNEFENKINISTPNVNVKPGQEVTLNIKTQSQSRVALLAIDLGAHLLSSNYNLNKIKIMRDLQLDQCYTPVDNIFFGGQSGLITLTNADVTNISPKLNFGIKKIIKRIARSKHSDTEIYSLVRTRFPETWIFKDIDITDENTSFTLQIPDTITTWLITAISINEATGFGMMDESLNITVFQPFFISLNLPYSIKRTEIVDIPVTIFNYYEENLGCNITMDNTENEFQFIDENGNALNATKTFKYITVVANSGYTVLFTVSALKVGQISIRVRAFNSKTSDAIHQQLKVEPEGILIKENEEVYLNRKTRETYNLTMYAYIPENIVPRSEFIVVSVGGGILLTALENLNNLIQLPMGCGEQNMVNFAPNILVLDYLKATGELEKHTELLNTALKYIEIGYQRELTFRHQSGGYSVFGTRGDESTWLTAYVIRFFIKALKYVAVDSYIITTGLDFLAEKQLDNGEFLYTGHLLYPAQQNRYGFTAFVLMSFMENRKYRKKYDQVIEKGLGFLSLNLANVNDTYALAIMATTFQMAHKDDNATLVVDKLLSMQQVSDDLKWWRSTDKRQSNDVEITSYVLMALLETSARNEHFSIFRWLIQQRNSNGGFTSTHNTVVGLQALIKFSEKYQNFPDTLLKINAIAKDHEGLELKQLNLTVEPDNVLIMQQNELPYNTRSIEIEVDGHGNALLQLSYQYYVSEKPLMSQPNTNSAQNLSESLEDETKTKTKFHRNGKSIKQSRSAKMEKSFIINPIAKLSADKEMLLEICFKYEPSDFLKFQKTNMIILEINLPSGFLANSESKEDLMEEDFITKVDFDNGDTKILIYFDQLEANSENCLSLRANQVYNVQGLMASTIEMYDYYNSDLRDMVFYEINNYLKAPLH